MKKIIACVIGMVMALSLCACGASGYAGEYSYYYDDDNYMTYVIDDDGTGYCEYEVYGDWDSSTFTWKESSGNIIVNYADGSNVMLGIEPEGLDFSGLMLEKQ